MFGKPTITFLFKNYFYDDFYGDEDKRYVFYNAEEIFENIICFYDLFWWIGTDCLCK